MAVQYVSFFREEQRFLVPLSNVLRIVGKRDGKDDPLWPEDAVVLDFRGHKRLGEGMYLLVFIKDRPVALWVDAVEGVCHIEEGKSYQLPRCLCIQETSYIQEFIVSNERPGMDILLNLNYIYECVQQMVFDETKGQQEGD